MKKVKTSDQSVYEARRDQFQKQLVGQKRVTNLVSNLRFIVFIGGIGAAVYLFYVENFRWSGICFTMSLFLFFFLVMRHEAMKMEMLRLTHLAEVNEAGEQRVRGRWAEFREDGKDFADPEHRYSGDLDIFGHASVYQWINATTTFFGKRALRRLLIDPDQRIAQIERRQEAVAELAEKLDWRQRFQVEGMITPYGANDPERLLAWLESPEERLIVPWHRVVLVLLPVITFVLVVMAFFTETAPYWSGVAAIVVQLVLLRLGKKKIDHTFKMFTRFSKTIKVYSGLLHSFEAENFTSKHMNELKVCVYDEKGRLASTQIKRLGRVLEMLDIRYVPLYHFLFNALFLWDFHCLQALEDWKERSGPALRKWLLAIGEAEALASLAVIGYDHPDWAYPELVEGRQAVYAKEMGHPLLLDEQRVCNNMEMQGSGTILLITGSNMSGKSTLLRTVGVNLVLAYAGAPVCAREFRCAVMALYSSMRVNDDLEKSISSFYAELLRVKMIIDASKRNEPLYFLLDEIFRGTNSRDRHTGAKTVLTNLSREGAMGLVSTHDLELGELENEKGLRIKNYHFRENYEGDQLCFDYKLRPGVSTTSNAIYLMKMVGIEIVES